MSPSPCPAVRPASSTPPPGPNTRPGQTLRLCALAALLVFWSAPPARAQVLSPADVLFLDTTKGQVFVEMRPDLAPKAVERIIMLSREGVYDGLQFHRVVDRFVAQTGNPNNRDGGVSGHPNLVPEFFVRLTADRLDPVAIRTADGLSGFLGSVPVQLESSRPRSDRTFRAWGAYCTGVAGMGRGASRDSANSEIFFMLEPSRALDHDYTVWGRVVAGLEVIQALNRGEPPTAPDLMRRVRVLADLPASERPVVTLDRTELSTRIQRLRASRGADFSICDVEIPVTVAFP